MDVRNFYKRPRKVPESGGEAEDPAVVSERRSSSSGCPETKCKEQQPSKNSVQTKKCLLEPKRVWKVFPRQQMAFEYAKTCWQNVAVFSFESEDIGREGQRKYLVTTYYEFGQQYLSMKHPRHYYEVIGEGSACHLYFDVEFKLEVNPHSDPLTLLETFIEYVCYQLLNIFGIKCDRHNILDLDSSTEKKFSRHLIFHLPNAVLRDNIHTGNFVHYMCDGLRGLKQSLDAGNSVECTHKQICSVPTRSGGSAAVCPSADRLLSLFVVNEKGEKVLICDEGVYTRNRNFRLYLSSKLAKNANLVVAKENTFRTSYSEDITNRRRSQLFNTLMDSLICNVRYERSLRVLEFETAYSKHRAKRRRRADHGSPAPSLEEGYNHSPYPLVDQFITSQLTRGGVQGSIRRWTYFPQGKLLVYDIQHNRWCENIGRAHKSNNIMLIADLSAGVYYQKCHDPECKRINFRSQDHVIPHQYNPVHAQGSSDEPQAWIGDVHAQGSSDEPQAWIRDVHAQGSSDEPQAWIGDVSTHDLEELQRDTTAECVSDEEFLERAAVEMDACEPDLRLESQASEHKCFTAETSTGLGSEMLGAEEGQKVWGSSGRELDSIFEAALDEFESSHQMKGSVVPEGTGTLLQPCDSNASAGYGVATAACSDKDGDFDLSVGEFQSFCEEQSSDENTIV